MDILFFYTLLLQSEYHGILLQRNLSKQWWSTSWKLLTNWRVRNLVDVPSVGSIIRLIFPRPRGHEALHWSFASRSFVERKWLVGNFISLKNHRGIIIAIRYNYYSLMLITTCIYFVVYITLVTLKLSEYSRIKYLQSYHENNVLRQASRLYSARHFGMRSKNSKQPNVHKCYVLL